MQSGRPLPWTVEEMSERLLQQAVSASDLFWKTRISEPIGLGRICAEVGHPDVTVCSALQCERRLTAWFLDATAYLDLCLASFATSLKSVSSL